MYTYYGPRIFLDKPYLGTIDTYSNYIKKLTSYTNSETTSVVANEEYWSASRISYYNLNTFSQSYSTFRSYKMTGGNYSSDYIENDLGLQYNENENFTRLDSSVSNATYYRTNELEYNSSITTKETYYSNFSKIYRANISYASDSIIDELYETTSNFIFRTQINSSTTYYQTWQTLNEKTIKFIFKSSGYFYENIYNYSNGITIDGEVYTPTTGNTSEISFYPQTAEQYLLPGYNVLREYASTTSSSNRYTIYDGGSNYGTYYMSIPNLITGMLTGAFGKTITYTGSEYILTSGEVYSAGRKTFTQTATTGKSFQDKIFFTSTGSGTYYTTISEIHTTGSGTYTAGYTKTQTGIYSIVSTFSRNASNNEKISGSYTFALYEMPTVKFLYKALYQDSYIVADTGNGEALWSYSGITGSAGISGSNRKIYFDEGYTTNSTLLSSGDTVGLSAGYKTFTDSEYIYTNNYETYITQARTYKAQDLGGNGVSTGTFFYTGLTAQLSGGNKTVTILGNPLGGSASSNFFSFTGTTTTQYNTNNKTYLTSGLFASGTLISYSRKLDITVTYLDSITALLDKFAIQYDSGADKFYGLSYQEIGNSTMTGTFVGATVRPYVSNYTTTYTGTYLYGGIISESHTVNGAGALSRSLPKNMINRTIYDRNSQFPAIAFTYIKNAAPLAQQATGIGTYFSGALDFGNAQIFYPLYYAEGSGYKVPLIHTNLSTKQTGISSYTYIYDKSFSGITGISNTGFGTYTFSSRFSPSGVAYFGGTVSRATTMATTGQEYKFNKTVNMHYLLRTGFNGVIGTMIDDYRITFQTTNIISGITGTITKSSYKEYGAYTQGIIRNYEIESGQPTQMAIEPAWFVKTIGIEPHKVGQRRSLGS